MRLSLVMQFVVLILIGCGVYSVANKYQVIERKVNRLDAQSEQEHENIRVLQAEWAFLTNPVRMEKIARDYFQLQPVDGTQLVMASAIPMRQTMDAQEAEINIAQKKSEPQHHESIQQAATQEAVPVVAAALPQAAALPPAMALPPAQALPQMEATPVSDVRGAQ
jgi:cell division protein FtsL